MTDRAQHLGSRPLVLWLCGALGTTVVGVAQDPTAVGFTETVEVEVVNVEVRVADREGLPVHDLTADDFQVFHDGQPVEVTNFTEFRGGDAAADGSGSTPKSGGAAAPNHSLIIYFDDLHLRADNREALIDALEAYLPGSRTPAGRIMILRQADRLNIEAPFGSSAGSLEQALKRLRRSQPDFGLEAGTRQALDEIQRAWNQSRDSESTGERGPMPVPGPEIAGSLPGATRATTPRDVTGSSGALGGGLVPRSCEIFESRVEAILDSWVRQRGPSVFVTLASLADSATYLAGLPGTKSLLYLGDALETMPGMELASYAETICPGGQRDRAIQALGEELDQAFRALCRHAAANRVTFFTLQGGGMPVASRSGAGDSGTRSGSLATFEASRRAASESGLILLADRTGGRAALNRSDFGVALQELDADMVDFYSLGYRPPPAAAAGADPTIEIRLRDTSLEARYRRSYADKSADQKFSEKLQGALFLGLVDNPLEAQLRAGEFRPGPGGGRILPLQVLLPVAQISLIPEGEQLVGSILVRVLWQDRETEQSRQTDRPFKVRHDPDSGGEWMQLPMELELLPGSHVVAIGVLDQESGRASLVSTTIEVPAT